MTPRPTHPRLHQLPATPLSGGAPKLLEADLGGMDLARAPRASADLKTRHLGPR